MKCKEIIEKINLKFPEKDALSWDNVGLQVGRFEKEISKVYIAVDATDDVIEDAIKFGADMLITHHPMIFSSLKKVNEKDFIGRKVLKLAQNDISYYAMHTNYDIHGMADLAIKKLGLLYGEVLDVTGEDESGNLVGIGKVATLDQEISLRDMALIVKNAYSLDSVRVFGDCEHLVHRVAICPGSGKSDINTAIAKGADVYITGDVGHHDCIDAVEKGLNIIDAGHYGVEHIFMDDMYQYLSDCFSDIEISVAPVKHPFFSL